MIQQLKAYLRGPEKRYIYSVLLTYEWDVRRTAKALGIGTSTLYRKIAAYNIKHS